MKATLVLSGLSISVMFLIESVSWFVRSVSLKGGHAYVISLSNIVLYSSRLFAFLFQMCIAIYIETRGAKEGLYLLFALGLAGAATTHIAVFMVPRLRTFVWRVTHLGIRLTRGWGGAQLGDLPQVRWSIGSRRIFAATAVSTLVFSLSLCIPYLLAITFIGYRLTWGSLTQIVNFLGTLLLLYFVDPTLFKMMDSGTLRDSIYDYLLGRIAGFSMGCVFLVVVILLS